MRHQRATVYGLVLVGMVLILAGTVTRAQLETAGPTDVQHPAGGFKPVQPIHDLMEGQKKLFTEIKEGIVDAQWEEASKAAWILAEIANVNQYQNKDPQYKGYAKRMSGDCVSLAKLLKKEDAKGAKQTFEKIGRTCSTCHKKFRTDE